MSRRALDALSLLTAGILVLTSQGFLLVPHTMKGLILAWPRQIVVAGGILLFMAGMFSAATTIFESYKIKSKLANSFAALCTAGLGAYYAAARCYLEIPLLFGLSAALLLASFLQGRERPLWKDALTLLGSLASAGAGLLLLVAENLPANELTQTGVWRIPLAGLFLAGAATGALAVLFPSAGWSRSAAKLVAAPWIGWSALSVIEARPAHVIPAICLAAVLLAVDLIPWPRFKLPSEDILGRRLVLLMAVAQSALIIGFVFLLETIRAIRFPGTTTGVLTFEDGRELVFLLNLGMEIVIGYALVSLIASIHELMKRDEADVAPPTETEEFPKVWNERIARLTRPFATAQLDTRKRLELQTQQAAAFGKQLEKEKRRTAQLTLLSEFSQQLEAQLDAPVAAQLAVNTLQKSLHCSFTALYVNDAERRELVALAASGTRASVLPPGYRQPINVGALGRAVRLRKTQTIGDVQRDPDYIGLENDDIRSLVIVPLIDHGHLKGLLEVSDNRLNSFSGHDVQIAEAVAAELLRAWERSEYHQRLTELIQAGISLTTQPDPQAAVHEVAGIARHTLRARFAFVTLLDQEGNFTRSAFAGNAPRLLKSLNQNTAEDPLMRAALNADRPFRIRDLRKYKQASHIDLDYPGLRSVIAIPIRVHRLSVGAMLAFGKQGEVFFTENDESLANLLSSQAAAAVESAWLSHELRTNLYTTTQLYHLSVHVIQAAELNEAVAYIAAAAQKLCGASAAGIALFSPEGNSEAEVQLNE
ncbi:MAG: GAF domain-containing protein, partial [Chloroflexota bacterium]